LAFAAALMVLLAACGSGAPGTPTAIDGPLLVGAAADLQPAFIEVGAEFTAHSGIDVTFSFGSSGHLAQQVIEGAPIDVFASANADFVSQVLHAGVGDAQSRQTYAFGRIVIWALAERWNNWTSLPALSDDQDVKVIAIANPEHAPYGIAARDALLAAGVWDEVQDRLIFGENIADTQRLAATGNADAAIVALSLALASDERNNGQGNTRWTIIDDDLHRPLEQQILVVTSEPRRREDAQAFVDFVLSDAGQAAMQRFGFERPPAPSGDIAGPPDAAGTTLTARDTHHASFRRH
ncbi:MAG: molybdate ABC transporter substrate-binding protein, partial [Nitriliruptoraceae bacterium]